MNIGFNIPGTIAVALVLLPNIIWMVKPPKNDPLRDMRSLYPVLDTVENIGRYLTMATAIFLTGEPFCEIWLYVVLTLCVLSLLAYWLSWALYYRGTDIKKLSAGMSVAPIAAMALGSMTAGGLIVLAPAALFLVAHLIVSARNYGDNDTHHSHKAAK